MNFQLSDEQRAIQQRAREFAQSELAPIAREIDEQGVFVVRRVAA